jgi:ribosomal-protein-alanine N-acetyltransferase
MIITFVCTGNTCRSAMAEGLCNKILKDRKIKDINCRSCGICAYTGDEATQQAIDAAAKLGADISSHRSTAINQYIVDSSDIIVCMTLNHKRAVMTLNPKCKVIVPDGGVSDPYGFGADVYEQCAAEIEFFLNKLIDSLTMQIVNMEERHVDGIAEIEKQCFSSPWSVDSIKAELKNDTAHFLVAVCGEKVLGYIGVHEVCGEAYIANLAVRTDYRRLGIGEKLLKEAQNAAFGRGCEFISLEVRKSNVAAAELYKKQGYVIEGERKSFYTNPTEDGLIMTLRKVPKECDK